MIEDQDEWVDAHRRKVGSEVYWLEHYHDIEARYVEWCREHHKDPTDVGSMVEYEQQYPEP